MSKVDISFCIPCCNVSKYIRACVDSITTQLDKTQKVKYEVLLLDDCSDDDTLNVIRSIEKENEKCRVLALSNRGGVSNARNIMIENASGEYIWFVDSDDMIYPNSCEIFLNIAKQYKADKLVFNYYECPDELLGSLNFDEMPIDYDENKLSCGMNIIPCSTNQNGAIAGSVCCALWRRQWILDNSIHFNTKVAIKEDVLFNFYSEQYDRMVVKVECPGYIYRVRSLSATTTHTDAQVKKGYLSSKEMCLIFKSYFVSDNSEKMKRRIDREVSESISLLQSINDISFVKKELKELKKLGWMPYKALSDSKTQKKSFRQVFQYEPQSAFAFWIGYYIRKIIKKIK